MAPPVDLATKPAAAFVGRSLVRTAAFAGILLAAGFLLRASGPSLLNAVHPTWQGALIVTAIGGLLTASGFPRQLVAFAAGYAFGAWLGIALALVAQMLGCATDFLAARTIACDWARRRLTGRWARLDTFLLRHPFTATLTLRLLPVSNNLLLNLLAGVAGLRALPFFGASLLGYVPQTAIFSLLGSGVQVGRAAQLGLGGLLFAASGLLGWVLYRRSQVPQGRQDWGDSAPPKPRHYLEQGSGGASRE